VKGNQVVQVFHLCPKEEEVEDGAAPVGG